MSIVSVNEDGVMDEESELNSNENDANEPYTRPLRYATATRIRPGRSAHFQTIDYYCPNLIEHLQYNSIGAGGLQAMFISDYGIQFSIARVFAIIRVLVAVAVFFHRLQGLFA